MVYYRNKFKTNCIPIIKTLEEIFSISMLVSVILKLITDLILVCNSIDIMSRENEILYKIYISYILLFFILSIYESHKEKLFYSEIKYTPYFDTNGNRIICNGRVIYYGVLYDLILEKGKNLKEDDKWYLNISNSRMINKKILLEDAVRDVEGKITLYEYGMGEKPNVNTYVSK